MDFQNNMETTEFDLEILSIFKMILRVVKLLFKKIRIVISKKWKIIIHLDIIV